MLLHRTGLEPAGPFPGKPTLWWLTRCLICGCEAHYRLEYVVDRLRIGEPTCRACYWRAWAAEARNLQGPYADLASVPREEAEAKATANGYDYLGALTEPSLRDDPHRVRCIYCGRLSAERLGDIGWGCQCQVNPRRDIAASVEGGAKKKRILFKDSGSRAVDWWDHERNTEEDWATATPKAHRIVGWRCPECGERFEKRVLEMSDRPTCPRCEDRRRAEREAERARYQNTTVAKVPELLTAWADDADPATVMVDGDWRLRRFRCPAGHHPRLSPLTFLRSGCPHCRGQQTSDEKLAAISEAVASQTPTWGLNPEIAEQWHPTRNGKLEKERISPRSRRQIWWREESCGHEWQATPAEREKRQRLRCPQCRTILDSLAYHFPRIAAEWSPSNPTTPWHVRPSSTPAFVPTWVCAADPAHVWQASLPSRTSGSGCPMCRETGKSAIELEVLKAAGMRFTRAVSGMPLRHPSFTARTVWHPDIVVELSDGRLLVIEYDGAYWHADKAGVDTAKSKDLLAAGCWVVRVREHPLEALPIHSDDYLEIRAYSTAPDPQAIVDRVATWVENR